MAQCPNILIVLTDQMRSTAMGCAGVENVRTPNIDAFAEQGMRYTNAISNTPCCAPARATFLTGKHVLQHGVINNELSLGTDHTSLAHALHASGYDCAYIGKWHVDGVNRAACIPPGPRRQGFDDYWAGTECNHHYFAGYYYDDAGDPVWFDTYEPEGQTELAIDYLQSRADKEDPFCMVLSWGPPHCPYTMVPERYRAMYPPEAIAFMPTAMDAGVMRMPAGSEEADAFKRETIAGYYAHVTALDELFGKLLKTLQALNMKDDTIVVFMSDHGDMLFNHDHGWKTKPWRESVGIPLIVRWPGRIEAGGESRLPIGIVDLMPTLLGLAGAAIPPEVQGLDLSRQMLGGAGEAPTSSWINYVCTSSAQRHQPWRGVVTERYTYAVTRDGPWLLYDDIEDSYQVNNLVDAPEAETIRDELQREVETWLQRTDDDFEDSLALADRYMGDRHEGCALPILPLEPVIKTGQDTRSDQTCQEGE